MKSWPFDDEVENPAIILRWQLNFPRGCLTRRPQNNGRDGKDSTAPLSRLDRCFA